MNDPVLISEETAKLFCDFRRRKLFSAGSEIPFETLKTDGAVIFDKVKGMGVFKGGVNEITDPKFDSSGWSLGEGASLDSSKVFTGGRSLKIEGSGQSGLQAGLKEKIPVTGAESRAITFYHYCPAYSSGTIELRSTAFGGDGSLLGNQSAMVKSLDDGWLRDGFIWKLPAGTAAYILEILSEAFAGLCYFDAFMAEAKDFFTPYFDGDSPGCRWVSAGTPQHLSASPVPGGSLSRALKPAKYFYRVSSVDEQGRESPASYEVSAKTGRRHRKIALAWDRDPMAFRYRVYRGGNSREQDSVVEVKDEEVSWSWSPASGIRENLVFDLAGNSAFFEDSGFQGFHGVPQTHAGNTGIPQGSRSLRPDPDVRIRGSEAGFDLKSNFVIAGEVEFGFSAGKPFRPCSFFEIGNPLIESMLAASVRYVPKWGDRGPQILLIKMFEGEEIYARERIEEFAAGSVIRVVAAQSYPGGVLVPGAHLWYKIDEGEVSHLFVPDASLIEGEPLLTISKRFYFDDFANNSYCRYIAFMEQAPEEKAVIEFLRG